MELSELKTRLKITDSSQDDYLTIVLQDAISYAQSYCNNSFLDANGELDLPSAVKTGITLIVKSMGESHNVASQSLGDMSKSFFENGTMNEALLYFKPFKKVKFV